MKPAILVTGAGGQLGSELRVLAAGRADLEWHFFDRAALPLDRTDLLAGVFARLRPAACINAAAYTAVDKAESEREQAFAANAYAVGELALLCKQYEALLIHASTDYVFDGQGTSPYRESDPVHPLGVYGASKLEGERLAMEAHQKVVIVRTSWVYSSYGKNFVKTMLRLLKEKESIGVVDDQAGRPTYAADLAAALLKILGEPIPGIYHYANQGAITWWELVRTIGTLIQSPCVVRPITTADYPTPARRPAYSVLDTTLIESTYGLAIPSWKESLQRCLNKLQ